MESTVDQQQKLNAVISAVDSLDSTSKSVLDTTESIDRHVQSLVWKPPEPDPVLTGPENPPPYETSLASSLAPSSLGVSKYRTISTKTASQTFNFWFGSVSIAAKQSESSNTDTSCVRQTKEIETEIAVLPKPWITRTGVLFSLKKLYRSVNRPELRFSLFPLTIISKDNPVIDVLAQGNLSAVQSLCNAGVAHPLALLPDRSNLLQVTIESLRYRLLFEDSVQDSKEMLVSYQRTCQWLLEQGVQPHDMNDVGK